MSGGLPPRARGPRLKSPGCLFTRALHFSKFLFHYSKVYERTDDLKVHERTMSTVYVHKFSEKAKCEMDFRSIGAIVNILGVKFY